mgnify:CR=1 FL=1
MKYLRCVTITAYFISIKAVEEDEVIVPLFNVEVKWVGLKQQIKTIALTVSPY